jgi:hypothetical protein
MAGVCTVGDRAAGFLTARGVTTRIGVASVRDIPLPDAIGRRTAIRHAHRDEDVAGIGANLLAGAGMVGATLAAGGECPAGYPFNPARACGCPPQDTRSPTINAAP